MHHQVLHAYIHAPSFPWHVSSAIMLPLPWVLKRNLSKQLSPMLDLVFFFFPDLFSAECDNGKPDKFIHSMFLIIYLNFNYLRIFLIYYGPITSKNKTLNSAIAGISINTEKQFWTKGFLNNRVHLFVQLTKRLDSKVKKLYYHYQRL